MQKTDNLFLGNDVRERLMSGVRRVADAVGATMGTSGQNSLLEALERPGFYATNDGATILQSISFADPVEEMGRKIISEAVSRANRKSGDGSSTTAVLCAAILEEGMKYIGKSSPMEIKRSLEACIPIIEASINAQKKEITIDTVKDVASISAEDEKIGSIIQEIYKKIGKDGIIQWDISKTPEDSYSIGTGITINDCGYVTQYFCDPGQKEIRLSNPAIILLRKKLTALAEFERIFPELFEQGKRDVVIFCDEFDMQPIADAINTRAKAGFRVVIVRMPTLWKDEWWEDLAVASGAKIVSEASGIKLLQATSGICGTFGNVTIGKEEVIIEGTKDLANHLLALKVDGSDAALNRAARLNIKTARYFVGAHSESALAYRRLKVEDALNAAACALENGVVAGGGIALLQIAKQLLDSETVGGKILYAAVQAPFEKILSNAGITDFGIPGPNGGIDTRTGKTVNMFEAGIIDPADVVLNAIKSAIGVAATILTVGTLILLPKEEPISQNQ